MGGDTTTGAVDEVATCEAGGVAAVVLDPFPECAGDVVLLLELPRGIALGPSGARFGKELRPLLPGDSGGLP